MKVAKIRINFLILIKGDSSFSLATIKCDLTKYNTLDADVELDTYIIGYRG